MLFPTNMFVSAHVLLLTLPSTQAVDLYVLERAFISTHEDSEPLVNQVMRTYKVWHKLKVKVQQDEMLLFLHVLYMKKPYIRAS